MSDSYVMMPSGLILPTSVAEEEARRSVKPKGMDFFAGAGGFSLGMIQAGWEVVAAVEMWPTAVMTYMCNLCRYGEVMMHFITDVDRKAFEKELAVAFKRSGVKVVDGDVTVDGKLDVSGIPMAGNGWISGQPRSTPGVSHIFVGDCRELKSERILDALGMKRGDLDAVMGGPPCQGYSTSGRRDVMDPRNSLVFEFARFIVELHPKTMVMEEVPNILNMVTPEGVGVVDQFCRILEDGGFGAINTFKRSIAAQTGGFGLLRGKKKPARGAEVSSDDDGEDEAPPSIPAAEQLDMFGGAP